MASLTSFLPKLAPHFGMTLAAVYERQRALVRLGLLPKPQGRGRGAGAQATSETVALICMSILATDNLSEMDERIATLASAPINTHYKKKYCRLTGAGDFRGALTRIMGDVDLARRVTSVDVRRKELTATVHWVKQYRGRWDFDQKNRDLTAFEHRIFGVQQPAFKVVAQLEGTTIYEIATALVGSDM
jgi:hypothetical protein